MTAASSPLPNDPTPGWGSCLAAGAAGTALRHIHQALAGSGPWRAAHQWATVMTTEPVTAHPDASGLYSGAPAVGYATALETLDLHIATATRQRLHRAHERIDRQALPALREFDLISGLTGVGLYLLHRHGGGDLLGDVLAYLVRLTQPPIDDHTLPGWWTGNGPSDHPSPQWPGGHANLGLAHGIAGPLALLSTTMRRGITVTGQADAIRHVCAWLDTWQRGACATPWWPEMISMSEWKTGLVRQPHPHRPSWCYGTPGLARAQQLAAIALADQPRQRRAEQALAGCLTDEQQLASISDASLCHGWAGLLQTTWRAAADPHAETDLAAHLPHLHHRLDDHLRRYGPPSGDGLLDGTSGIHLVRDTTTAAGPPATDWDACLLLAG
jgi:hypothetical protein